MVPKSRWSTKETCQSSHITIFLCDVLDTSIKYFQKTIKSSVQKSFKKKKIISELKVNLKKEEIFIKASESLKKCQWN
jgi:Fic family protein